MQDYVRKATPIQQISRSNQQLLFSRESVLVIGVTHRTEMSILSVCQGIIRTFVWRDSRLDRVGSEPTTVRRLDYVRPEGLVR